MADRLCVELDDEHAHLERPRRADEYLQPLTAAGAIDSDDAQRTCPGASDVGNARASRSHVTPH